jgi:hypothetical protein
MLTEINSYILVAYYLFKNTMCLVLTIIQSNIYQAASVTIICLGEYTGCLKITAARWGDLADSTSTR